MWPLGLGAQKDVNRVLYFSIKINNHFRLNKNDMDWWYLCPCCPPFYLMYTFIIVLFVNVKTFRKLSKYLVCLGELLNRNCLSSNTQECLFTVKVKLKSFHVLISSDMILQVEYAPRKGTHHSSYSPSPSSRWSILNRGNFVSQHQLPCLWMDKVGEGGQHSLYSLQYNSSY